MLPADAHNVLDGLRPGPLARRGRRGRRGRLGRRSGGGLRHAPSIPQSGAVSTNVSTALDVAADPLHTDFESTALFHLHSESEHAMSPSEFPDNPGPALFVVTGAGPVGWSFGGQLAP